MSDEESDRMWAEFHETDPHLDGIDRWCCRKIARAGYETIQLHEAWSGQFDNMPVKFCWFCGKPLDPKPPEECEDCDECGPQTS